MSVHHVNTTYTFEKLKPMRLRDARPTTINLKAQNGKASFRYKVGGLFTSCGTYYKKSKIFKIYICFLLWVFFFKVGRFTQFSRQLENGGEPNTLYWYVMPCGGVVHVEIFCRKTLLLEKRVIGYEKLVLNNIKKGERYVLKVETVSADETQRVGSIEVSAK